MDHKQSLTNFGVYVDEEIKDLIEILNENNFYTNNSCQCQSFNNNKTWICFEGFVVNELMKEIFKHDKKLFEYLINSEWDIVHDVDYENDGEMCISLRFPYNDLKYITESFQNIFKK